MTDNDVFRPKLKGKTMTTTEMQTETKNAPPEHLSDESKAWYQQVATEFAMDQHHLFLLQCACENWDRSQSARREIEKNGLTVLDRFDQIHARPEVAIQKTAQAAFVRVVRELRLDESSPEEARLPRNRKG